jgi:hypothetical protein
MISDEILSLVPVVLPAATALVGLFIPSPGPTVVRWSAAWWVSLVQTLGRLWQAKPVQAEAALVISPAIQAIINEAVAVAMAAVKTQTPTNTWLTPTSVVAPSI